MGRVQVQASLEDRQVQAALRVLAAPVAPAVSVGQADSVAQEGLADRAVALAAPEGVDSAAARGDRAGLAGVPAALAVAPAIQTVLGAPVALETRPAPTAARTAHRIPSAGPPMARNRPAQRDRKAAAAAEAVPSLVPLLPVHPQ